MLQTLVDKGNTVLIIEHNMDVIMQSSDMIILLNKGEVIAVGTFMEISSIIMAFS